MVLLLSRSQLVFPITSSTLLRLDTHLFSTHRILLSYSVNLNNHSFRVPLLVFVHSFSGPSGTLYVSFLAKDLFRDPKRVTRIGVRVSMFNRVSFSGKEFLSHFETRKVGLPEWISWSNPGWPFLSSWTHPNLMGFRECSVHKKWNVVWTICIPCTT